MRCGTINFFPFFFFLLKDIEISTSLFFERVSILLSQDTRFYRGRSLYGHLLKIVLRTFDFIFSTSTKIVIFLALKNNSKIFL